MVYVIGNKRFSVAVDSFGAELNSIKKNGVERLWQNYDGSWDGHAPVLFPFCGHCAVKFDGKDYSTPAHGFARQCEFSYVSQTESELKLNLKSDAETKKVYPFDFSFTVTYAVKGYTLFITYEMENTGKKTLFFGCGGHESFNIDGALEDYRIEFEKEESLLRLFHNENGYLNGESVTYPESRYLNFSKVPVNNSDTLIFKGIKSRKCSLVNCAGERVATVYFNGFSNLLFWRPDGAAMICIEPWTNLPDFAGKDDREFSAKEGIYPLNAGGKSVFKRKLCYRAG